MTLSGPVSGPGALALTDAGTLVLSGTANGYGGGTYVEQGTLVADSAGSIPDGTPLVMGAGGTFLFDPTVTGAAPAAAAPAGAVSPVPEPGTIVLLLAALWSAAIYRRFRGTVHGQRA